MCLRNTGFLFKVKIIPASIYVVLQEAVMDEGVASWRLGAGPRCPGGWCLAGLLLVHVCFNLGALFPAGALVGSFCVCSCCHAFIFTKKHARCFPSLSLVQQHCGSRAGAGWRGAVPWDRAGSGGSGPRLRPGGNLGKEGCGGQALEHTQGNRTGTEPRQ